MSSKKTNGKDVIETNGGAIPISHVVILVGVSGTGKTTVAKQITEEEHERDNCSCNTAIICSTDKFIDEEAKKLGIPYQKCMENIQKEGRFKEITGKFYDEIEESIKADKHIIIDRTNLTKGSRKALLGKLSDIHKKYDKNMEVMAVCFNLTRKQIDDHLSIRELETGKTIPSDVVDKQLESFEVATKDEGFDFVQYMELTGDSTVKIRSDAE